MYNSDLVNPLKDKEQFIENHKTKLSEDDLTMFPKPKDGCKFCYGRGYSGWKKDTTALCRCIINKINKIKDPEKLLTYKELLKIMYTKKDGSCEIPQDSLDVFGKVGEALDEKNIDRDLSQPGDQEGNSKSDQQESGSSQVE